MGVPKFFRYISERYPCLSELVKEYQIPEFDHLYLDMNGIIHMCSHPNDFDPHFRITEERIFQDIFHYIEVLFRLIQPRKLFFMAIDGVAPRAKMNQQRGRRFRSAKEAEILEERAKKKGEVLPSEARFDSNCITPGTHFMEKLHEQLEYFIALKISTNKNWRDVKVILSGHETPGEGEHKIMDYIRWMKAQPDYDPNTRHCLYGLDADLIMLGLCTHEPHFSLLREEVKFGKKADSKRCSTPEATRFYLLHLSLMREYLELEFQALKGKLCFPFDLECIIDDWVLMGFLVGNDFIPPLPDLHIANGALPMLYNAYIEVLPSLDGYINEQGTLHIARFQKFMEKLASFDVQQFRETYADTKFFEGKTGRKPGSIERHSYLNGKVENRQESSGNAELDALIKATDDKFLDDEETTEGTEASEDDDDVDVFNSRVYNEESDTEMSELMKMEFHQHKRDYYRNKLEYGKVTQQVLRDQAEGYVRAIQWNLHYYYHGVASWSWYYPHHYAPYISDICNFKDVNLDFDLGKPFQPFEQLLAVLPAASKSLLPKPYQKLMVEESSAILEFYPADFQTDLNGKKQDWEAVVLIPFIDEDRLLSAMKPLYEMLSDDERDRNRFGPMSEYTFTCDDLGEYNAPDYFPTIKNCHAKETYVWREQLYVKRENIVHGLLPGAKLDVYYPGFPTFKHLAYLGKLKKAKVQVFDQASRGENMILTLSERNDVRFCDLKAAAVYYLGKDVFCGWPHLSEARVVEVSDGSKRYRLLSSGEFSVEDLEGLSIPQWKATANGKQEEYMRRQGVAIGQTNLLLYVLHVEGRKYIFANSGKISLEKTYENKPTPYPVQTIVNDIAVHDPSFVQYKTLSDVFPPGSKCFVLAPSMYGAMGEVSNESRQAGRVRVTLVVSEEPNMEDIVLNKHSYSTHYMFGNKAAQRIGISSHLLSRITGTVFLITGNKQDSNPSKMNIGLNLKFNKKNEEVPGYTKKVNNTWLYSSKAVDIVKQYVELFPEVFDSISLQSANDVYDDKDIFGDDCDGKIAALGKWLKSLPCANCERRGCGAEVLDVGVIEKIDAAVKKYLSGPRRVKTLHVRVRPHVLYKSDLKVGNLPPDPTTTYMLFDRVVNVCDNSPVPLGSKGTLIGIHRAEIDADTMYDVHFDKPFPGGMSLGGSPGHLYRMSRGALINLSHGERLNLPTQAVPKTIVKELADNASSGPRPASAFASWNSTSKGDGSQGQNWRSENNSNCRGLNAASKGPRGFDFPAPPNISPKRIAPIQPPSSQEQELWTNLQMMFLKKTAKDEAEPSIDPMSKIKVVSEIRKSKKAEPQTPLQSADESSSHSQVGRDSETNVLKKILGIRGQNGEESLRPQYSSNQVPVHPAMKPAGAQGSNSCSDETKVIGDPCGRLLSLFQSLGTGVPVFTYFQQQHGSTRAELVLPDGQVVCGDESLNKHEAAENVARKALKMVDATVMSSGKKRGPLPQSMYQPQQFFQQFQKGHFPLPPPPRPPAPSEEIGKVIWNSSWSSAAHPARSLPQQFQQTYRNPSRSTEKKVQQQQNVAHQKLKSDSEGVCKHAMPQNLPRQQPWSKEQSLKQKSLSAESKSFVPLQAMKQQRSAVKSAALLRREHEEQNTADHGSVQSNTMNECTSSDHGSEVPNQLVKDQQARSEVSPHLPVSEANEENSSNGCQESRSVSGLRKSRLAINFNISNEKQ